MRRCSQSQLDEMARKSRFAKQAQTCNEMLNLGWHVYCIRYESDYNSATVICMSQHHQGTTVSAGVIPNGRVIRPKVGQKSFKWSWADVRAAATMQVA